MDAVQATLARTRLIVAALAAGVLCLAGIAAFVDFGRSDLGAFLGLPAGLLGLIMLVAGWRVHLALRERAARIEDLEAGCARYTTAVLIALALTEGAAFLGIVAYMLGAEVVALTGVVTHVLLTGVLWPAPEKLQPFLGRAGHGPVE